MLLRMLTLGFSCLWLLPSAKAEPIQATLLLKNSQILDGTLTPAKTGNVAINQGVIVAVGEFEVAGTPWTLDCTGMIVCPGFIDLHNHSDRPITEPLTRGAVNFLMQGCTTIVNGNCGSGPTDAGKLYAKIDQHGAGVNVASPDSAGGSSRRGHGEH